ncbi:putative disease resistance protein RGA4 [Zingiber officinale]|nr:putative disease resistance protein RGA4 [Zingiber officinale]
MKTKKYIDSLKLEWYEDTFDLSEFKKDEKQAEWLEYLEPHVNLKTLKIMNYLGVRFVGWVGASSFTKLKILSLQSCKNCNKLPPLGQLPSLEELKICRMDGVQHVGREFCSMLMASPSSSQNKIAFPSLKRLIFSNMTNWKAWDGVEIGDFPSLHYIRISVCPRLIKFPQWPFMSSVKEMELDYSGVPDVSNFHSLTNLTIAFMSQEYSKWMSRCYFPMLQHLRLSFGSAESVHLSQKVLPSLKTLGIHDSEELRVVTGLKNLTSLNSLIIEACPNLEFKGLPATLKQVKFNRCPLFEKGFKEQQHMRNVLMIEAHNSDDEEEEKEEMDGEDDDNMD